MGRQSNTLFLSLLSVLLPGFGEKNNHEKPPPAREDMLPHASAPRTALGLWLTSASTNVIQGSKNSHR